MEARIEPLFEIAWNHDQDRLHALARQIKEIAASGTERMWEPGRTNKDVSLILAVSLDPVATHFRSILNKTQCASRTEAATYAIRHGLRIEQSGLSVK